MAGKQTIQPAENMKKWLSQPFFWIALVVVAFVVGQNMHPADSQASLAPSPTITVPAPVVAPAPATERIVYLQQPAPAPITNNNIIMVGADEPGTVLKEIPAVMQQPYTPKPKPVSSKPPKVVKEMKQRFLNDDCNERYNEHLERVAEWKHKAGLD